MTRYRIVIEVETNENRVVLNQLAQRMSDEAVTRYSNPVFLSTEIIEDTRNILNSDRNHPQNENAMIDK